VTKEGSRLHISGDDSYALRGRHPRHPSVGGESMPVGGEDGGRGSEGRGGEQKGLHAIAAARAEPHGKVKPRGNHVRLQDADGGRADGECHAHLRHIEPFPDKHARGDGCSTSGGSGGDDGLAHRDHAVGGGSAICSATLEHAPTSLHRKLVG